MLRIAGKLEFIKGRTVEVCTIAKIGIKEVHKKSEKYIKIKSISVFL